MGFDAEILCCQGTEINKQGRSATEKMSNSLKLTEISPDFRDPTRQSDGTCVKNIVL